jgi:hypothetical protein
MKSHEQTIENHVKTNVAVAIDQSESYGGLENAFFAFLQNTTDSVLEDGYSAAEAMDASDWFVAEFRKQTGIEI